MNFFTLITSDGDDYIKLLDDLKGVEEIAFDIESNSLDPHTGLLILSQLEVNDECYIIDNTKLDVKHYKRLIRRINNLNLKIIGHNIKFDIKCAFANTGILLENVYDTMTTESLVTGGDNLYSSYSELVQKYCNVGIDKDVRNDFINFDGIVTQEMLVYSGLDVKYLRQIKDKQLEIISETKQDKVFDLEMKLVPVVANMELVGVGLDVDKWNAILEENIELRDEIYQNIINTIFDKFLDLKIKYDNALDVFNYFRITSNNKTKGEKAFLEGVKEIGFIKELFIKNLNFGSWVQVLKVLHMFGIDVESTGEKVLNTYVRDSKPSNEQKNLIKSIINYREQNKKITSYGEEFVKKLNPVTGRLHADFTQIGTRTGRMACSGPNLQNIPALPKYRNCFIPRPGYKFLVPDYSQQEYRLAGWLSGEETIINDYKNDIDIHTSTACLVYDTSPRDVTKDQRDLSKNINFAVLYLSSIYGLAFNMNITVEKADEIIRKFTKGRPRLIYYRDKVADEIWKRFYSVTPLGRRRNFENRELFSSGREASWYETMVKREGFNHVVQGGSGDMIKRAMNLVYYKNPFGNLLNIIIQVHDEIVVEVHESILEQAKIFVVDCMEKAGKEFLGEIPAKVSVSNEYNCWSK